MQVDWGETLNRVQAGGRAYLPGAIDEAACHRLLEVEVEWRQLDERLPSGVYQQYSFASIEPHSNAELGRLCATIQDNVAAAASQEFRLDDFVLNEASLHRYQRDDAGLGKHRDMHFYRLLVIGITLAGSGELHLFDDGSDTPTEVWDTEPGDLYVFRAPGLAGGTDGRPAHATGPTDGRTSLTLRYNQHGFGGGW